MKPWNVHTMCTRSWPMIAIKDEISRICKSAYECRKLSCIRIGIEYWNGYCKKKGTTWGLLNEIYYKLEDFPHCLIYMFGIVVLCKIGFRENVIKNLSKTLAGILSFCMCLKDPSFLRWEIMKRLDAELKNSPLT